MRGTACFSPWRPALAAILALSGPGAGLIAAEHVSPAAARLRTDVTFLADDAQEGRAPGTKGIEAAADYIAAAFRDAGLKPAPGADGYFQPFTIGGNARLGTPLALSLVGPEDKTLKAEPKVDFTPLAIGTGGTLDEVGVVFAGYGITAKDDDEEARLRRLRRPRRQGEGRPDPPPRAAAGQGGQPVRREADDELRHVPAQGHQRLPARRGGRPAGQRRGRPEGRQGRAPRLHRRGPRAELEHPVPDALASLRGQAPRRCGPADLEGAGGPDRRRPQAPLEAPGRVEARRGGGHRAQAGRDEERGRRPGRARAPGRRDDRHRRPLRPPGARRPALGLARVPLQGHPQRGRRQRLGDGDGHRAGPSPGEAGRSPAPSRRLHRLLGRGARAPGVGTLRRAPALSARSRRP